MGPEKYHEFFNDIVSNFCADDLLSYKTIVKNHEKSLRKFLKNNGIKVNQYASIEAFEHAKK